MFRGITALNLDAKGRMALPTRYRECLQTKDQNQSELVLTIDPEEYCLLLYPLHEWELIEQKLGRLPSFDKASRRIQRLLIGHATEITMDNNGRILLPQLLCEYANIVKEQRRVMLIGQGKKFELWDEQHWQGSRECWLNKEANGDVPLPAELAAISL